jgi:Tfp pilus assembly protein PilE
MHRKGFKRIELLIVVACGIGILAACEATSGPSPEETIVASMKSDLLRLVAAQDAFFSDNNDYAGNTVNGNQVNGVAGAGEVSFVPSTGNVLWMTYVNESGWKATMTHPATIFNRFYCGIYIGPRANAPDPAVTQEGAPGCW